MHGDDTTTTPTYTVPRNRLRVSATAGALIALAISLTACTDDPAQVTTPTGETTTASTPSTPAPPEPTRPVEEATPASAIQFTRYFWDLYNYAYQTYDTAPLKAISDPKCKYCASTITDVERIASAKTRVKGFQLEVLELASPPVDIKSGTVVVVAMKQQDGTSIRADGTSKPLKGYSNKRFTVGLNWSDQGWAVRGISIDDAGPP